MLQEQKTRSNADENPGAVDAKIWWYLAVAGGCRNGCPGCHYHLRGNLDTIVTPTEALPCSTTPQHQLLTVMHR